VPFLERYPVLKKVVANQYQAILVAGATAFSALTLNPLPLLLLAGVELMAMPFLMERIKRRLEIEKKHAERQTQSLSQEQRFMALTPTAKARFNRLRQLCERIQGNYRGLSTASQSIIADQAAKFDILLASCLHRLWLLQKYDEMIGAFDSKEADRNLAELRKILAAPDLEQRVREAVEKNLQIREQLLLTVRENVANRTALVTELDSLEALLQLLLQKSVAATDALAFSSEVDDVLSQAEADAASIREMEQMIGSMPAEMGAEGALSARIKQAFPLAPPPPPPPPPRKPTASDRRRF
jgi:hypothetical protein